METFCASTANEHFESKAESDLKYEQQGECQIHSRILVRFMLLNLTYSVKRFVKHCLSPYYYFSYCIVWDIQAFFIMVLNFSIGPETLYFCKCL